MEIEKLISVFEKLLPIYKEDYDNKRVSYETSHGLCFTCLVKIGPHSYCSFCETMNTKSGYYKNLMGHGVYLFPRPKTFRDLKSRIDFMESEVKSLKRLQKRGYTHV